MTTYTLSLKDGMVPGTCHESSDAVNFSPSLPQTLAASDAATLEWSSGDYYTFEGVEIVEGPVSQASGQSVVDLLTFNPNSQGAFSGNDCSNYDSVKSRTYQAQSNSLTMTVSSTVVRSYMYVLRLWFSHESTWWFVVWSPTVIKQTVSTYTANSIDSVPSRNSDGSNAVSVSTTPPSSNKYGDRLRFAWKSSSFAGQSSNNTSLQGVEFLNTTDTMFVISSGDSYVSSAPFPGNDQPFANYCLTNPTYSNDPGSDLVLAVSNPKREAVLVKIRVWFKSGRAWWYVPEQFEVTPRTVCFTFKAKGSNPPAANSAASSEHLSLEATAGYSLSDVELGPSDSVRWAWDQDTSGSPWSAGSTVIFQGMQILSCDRVDDYGNATAALNELDTYAGLRKGTETGLISNRADGQYTPIFQAVAGQLEMVDKQLSEELEYLGIRYLLWFTTTTVGSTDSTNCPTISTSWWYVDPEVDFEPPDTAIPPDDDYVRRRPSKARHPLRLR